MIENIRERATAAEAQRSSLEATLGKTVWWAPVERGVPPVLIYTIYTEAGSIFYWYR